MLPEFGEEFTWDWFHDNYDLSYSEPRQNEDGTWSVEITAVPKQESTS